MTASALEDGEEPAFAAPRWAGYLALVNQQSSGKGHGTLGLINPVICGIGLGASYAADFHDITERQYRDVFDREVRMESP